MRKTLVLVVAVIATVLLAGCGHNAVTIGIDFTGEFNFSIVPYYGREDFPIPQIKRHREIFWINSGIKANAIAVGNGVMPTAGEQHGGDDCHQQHKCFTHFCLLPP